jgi:PAS domain S-box-containing protein
MFTIRTSYNIPALEGQATIRALFIETAADHNQELDESLASMDIDVQWVETLKEALEKIEQDNVDVVWLNTTLPDSNGLEAMQAIRKKNRALPIVVVNDIENKAMALQILRAGAQDYLTKGALSDKAIARCLRYAIERHRLRYEQLLEGEHSTRLILENSLQAFLAIDKNGIILDWNLRAEGLFGWTRQEAVGKHIAELVRPSPTRDAYLKDLKTTLSDSPEGILNKRMEVYALHKDGHYFSIEFGFFRIKDKYDYFYCTFVNDITERKEIENKRKQLNEELEEMVQERTTALMRSNEELQQFAKIASHDLQEPLRAVEGFAKLLDRRYRDKLDTVGVQFLEFILDGVVRMQKLIQSVLEHSSISTDKKEIQPVEVSSVLKEVMKNLNLAIKESKATIIYGDLPLVAVERLQLIQLFQNIISNAIKYASDERPPYIIISAEKSVDEWLFSIRDNGIGIDNKYAERIFDMFARLHGRVKYSGTGMGLAICKKIVTAHGGRIWMESELGEGSIFFFTLPGEKKH